MAPLPSEVPFGHQENAYIVSVYNMCLRLEKSLEKATIEGRNVEKDLIYVRILGFLVHHVPTDEGLKTVVVEISSTGGDFDPLLRLGKMYFDHYIRACTFSPLSLNVPSDMVTQLELIRVEHQRPQIIYLVAHLIQLQI